MMDPGTIDFEDVETSNLNDSVVLYYSYDHPFWKKQEEQEAAAAAIVNKTFPTVNTTLGTMPDIYDLNSRKAVTFYPIFIILGCIVVLGVLSNILVCYIYRCRSRRATSNFFVIFFAIFDICGCLIGIPFEVSALALPYIYDLVPVCKIMGFIETGSVCGLCLTLICVAYDCYGKLCRPGEDFSVKKARNCCIVSVIISVLISIPAPVVFGIRDISTTEIPEMYGKTCGVDPSMPQWLRIVYNVCVLGSFTVSLCAMTVLYCLIGVTWCRQRQAEERGEKPSPGKREFPKKHRFVREDTSTSSVNYSEEICRLHSQGNLSRSNQSRSDPARVPLKTNNSGIVKTNSLQASSAPPSVAIVQLHVKNTRQAFIFLVISIVFVVTMIPFVVVMILCAVTTVFNRFSSNATEIVFNICIRSYLLSYLVKPVVYLIFNVNFRKEVKHLFIKVWAFCTRSDPNSEQASTRPLRRSFTMGASRSASRTPIYRPPRSSN